MSRDPFEVHENLMRALPVRTVLCLDHDEEFEPRQIAPEVRHTRPRTAAQREPFSNTTEPASYLSPIEHVEIGERRMLSLMSAGQPYSAKHLSALAGMNEKFFYTHVLRMVRRGQLVRLGRRHHFRYRRV